MTNQRSSRRRPFPPYDESCELSRRDQTLARVEKLLSEQLIAPLQDEASAQEDEPLDLVDLKEAVETAKLPPEERPRPQVKPPLNKSEPQDLDQTPVPTVEPPEKKTRLSTFSAVLQGAILIFVLAWVFLLGILVGRGHLWQAGLGHKLVVWVEQKAGWTSQAGPEIVLKKENQPDEIIRLSTGPNPAQVDQNEKTMAEAEQTADDMETLDSGTSDKKPDDMPVWNWPGWSPGSPENPLGEPQASETDQPPTASETAHPLGGDLNNAP